MDSKDNSYLVSTSLKNERRSHEDSSFIVSTSLKNETTPFPNRVLDYGLVKPKLRLSKISEVNLHSNHELNAMKLGGHAPRFALLCWGHANLSRALLPQGSSSLKNKPTLSSFNADFKLVKKIKHK